MNRNTLLVTCLALLATPALAQSPVRVASEQGAWPLQMDAGSLGLFGAGLVILAISRSLKRRP